MGSFRPRGIWGAVILPVQDGAAIDMAALGDLVDILCGMGLAGLYTNGTAAEFFNQTEAEFDAISDLVLTRAGRAGVPVQIGVSSSNPRVARARLRRIARAGAVAAQITLPDWWPPSAAEQARFIEGMSDAADGLPLILYNPPTAKVRLDVPGIAALRRPSLVGVKVAGGDAGWYAQRRALLGDMSVFVAGHTVAFGRPQGADGAYSNVACLSPRGAVRQWDMIETDPEAARDIETRFRRFLNETMIPLARDHGLSDAALDKAMAAAGGWGPVGPGLLWPYSGATSGMVKAIRQSANHLLPDLLDLSV